MNKAITPIIAKTYQVIGETNANMAKGITAIIHKMVKRVSILFPYLVCFLNRVFNFIMG